MASIMIDIIFYPNFKGKFIRIHFNQAGKLSGADMEVFDIYSMNQEYMKI